MELSLGVRALMIEIDGLAKTRGFAEARVHVKVNVRREPVIALLIPARIPDEWGSPSPSAADREAKRLARERRG